MIKNITPEGFKDDVSSKVATEYNFKNTIVDYFLLNGFELVKTPLIEYINRSTSKNVFKISVKKKCRKIKFAR